MREAAAKMVAKTALQAAAVREAMVAVEGAMGAA